MRQFVCLCAVLLVAAIGHAADGPAKPPKSLDAQLLDDLNADLLGGLPAPAKQATPAEQPAQPDGASDPLAQIAERMRAVQQRVAGGDTSDETLVMQRQIQAELAVLIEQAKQQCAACKKAGSGQGTQAGNSAAGQPAPPRDSTNRIEQGTKEATETADVKEIVRRFWGHLPDKIRDQMQSSLSEEFLPKYQRLIEDYYQRLAEDSRTGP